MSVLMYEMLFYFIENVRSISYNYNIFFSFSQRKFAEIISGVIYDKDIHL